MSGHKPWAEIRKPTEIESLVETVREALPPKGMTSIPDKLQIPAHIPPPEWMT